MEFEELKDKMSDTHKNNLLDELNRSREMMENRIRELENTSIEFTQSEEWRASILEKENRVSGEIQKIQVML